MALAEIDARVNGYDIDHYITLDMDGNLEPSAIEWREGTEKYRDWTPQQLFGAMGLPGGKIPYLQSFIDREGQETGWDMGFGVMPTLEQLAATHNTGDILNHRYVRFTPLWHQLVGVFVMLHNAFEGKPVLLMDGVGLGKTLQSLMVICMLRFYRQYYAERREYPGIFS